MIKFRRMYSILKRTGALRMLIVFVIFLCFAAFVLRLTEPQINTVGEGFWYCFVACTTIGFGDIAAVTPLGRVITMIVGIYGILMTAMVPGIIVSYYMEFLKTKEDDTISTFLEKLEQLPSLSHKELTELAERVKRFNNKY